VGYWGRRWDDIRGNLLFAILVWVFGGGLITAVFQVFRTLHNHPFEWNFIVIVFLISVLSLAVVMLVASRKGEGQRAALAQTQRVGALVVPTANFDAPLFFRNSYNSCLESDTITNVRAVATQSQPNDKEGFYTRLIAVGLIAYVYDMIWSAIYKSQLLALLELNRRSGFLPLVQFKSYYDRAAIAFPTVYAHYSFDQWLAFMKTNLLILLHPSDMVEITVRGKDFLKYLLHWGRDAEQRNF
jgi:hypothetical protein